VRRTLTITIIACVLTIAGGLRPPLEAQNPQAPGGAPGGGGFIAYPQRAVTDPNAVARGKVLFDVNCSFCHGADARGGDDGPNLLRSELVLEDKNGESIGPVLLNGRDRGMPKFTFTTGQISDVAAYIHSFPVSSRTGPGNINIVVGNAKAGEVFFNTKCASCHSVTGDLKGLATKYTDPKALQQTWLLPGSGGRLGGAGTVRTAPPMTAVVTLPSGEKVEGKLDRIDDFVVSLTLPDGTHRSFVTEGNTPAVAIRDPLQAHKDLLRTYADSDIHNVTAFLVNLK
jgi:cytochrome c oxidase cbb3-type subunit III